MNRACIIGAGSSGIVAAKVLAERGLAFVCYEKGSGIGGNWRYENDNGLSAAYQSLHINTSRDRMAFSDFPMPADYPDYPDHRRILQYFEAYIDHFGLRNRITFSTSVERVVPAEGGAYAVTVRGPDGVVRTERFGAVLVANGHHWCPNEVAFPGTFDGTTMHAHAYRTPDVLAGRRVLVVGVGNSGCDIACEASRVAARTYLSTRRGAHVVPKYLLGRPLDHWGMPLTAFAPLWVQRAMLGTLVFLSRGRQQRYGFPVPDHPLLSEHPTVSSELLDRIGHGDIVVKPNIDALEGDHVRFTDGTRHAVDVIVYATGYRVSFPFFEDGFMAPSENRLPLYHHVVPPEQPNLYFIGLIQPLGAVMPLAELQAEWVADLLAGDGGLPDPAAMHRAIERERRRIERQFVASPRHTMEVDTHRYAYTIRRERRRARRRTANQHQVSRTEPARPSSLSP